MGPLAPKWFRSQAFPNHLQNTLTVNKLGFNWTGLDEMLLLVFRDELAQQRLVEEAATCPCVVTTDLTTGGGRPG